MGVFLSSGVDSASVANLAQKNSKTPVNTFTLAFEEQEYNEGIVAKRIADAIGTRHQEVVLTEQQFISQLEPALDSLDQPTFDGINSYYMSHAVRQAGLKVALIGTGGDELFGGYATFRELPALITMVETCEMDSQWDTSTAGKGGFIGDAAIQRFSPAADTLGQASGNDPTW